MMNEAACVELLEQHGIKPTANRIVVVRALAATGHPLSLSELELKILSIDKSGIFRALTLFREHRLVHAIEGGSEGTRYELCRSHDHEHDEDLHPHFFCEACQQTYCLDYMDMPRVSLPEGFRGRSANLVVRGLCPHCAEKAK